MAVKHGPYVLREYGENHLQYVSRVAMRSAVIVWLWRRSPGGVFVDAGNTGDAVTGTTRRMKHGRKPHTAVSLQCGPERRRTGAVARCPPGACKTRAILRLCDLLGSHCRMREATPFRVLMAAEGRLRRAVT